MSFDEEEFANSFTPPKKPSFASKLVNFYGLVITLPISIASLYVNLLIIKQLFGLDAIDPFWHAIIFSPLLVMGFNLLSSSCDSLHFLQSKTYEKEETVLKRQIAVVGSNLTTTGSLTAPSIKIAGGNCSIAGTLTVEKKLEVSGNLRVKDDLVSKGRTKIGGHCTVGRTITGEDFYVYGTTEAESISGKIIKLNGSMEIRGDIRATQSVELLVRRAIDLQIDGVIIAPEVTIKKKRLSLSGFVLKILGLGKQYTPEIILSDIEIEAERLILIDVEIDEIDQDEIDQDKAETTKLLES